MLLRTIVTIMRNTKNKKVNSKKLKYNLINPRALVLVVIVLLLTSIALFVYRAGKDSQIDADAATLVNWSSFGSVSTSSTYYYSGKACKKPWDRNNGYYVQVHVTKSSAVKNLVLQSTTKLASISSNSWSGSFILKGNYALYLSTGQGGAPVWVSSLKNCS